MANELIIGRNYFEGKIIPDGGEQSQEIDNLTVSRNHLKLYFSDRGSYYIETIRVDQKLYVNGAVMTKARITGNEKIEIGAEKYALDIGQAINDYERKFQSDPMHTIIEPIEPTTIIEGGQPGPEPEPEPIDPVAIEKTFEITRINRLFNIANITLIILFIISFIVKDYKIPSMIVLFFLAIALVVDIYLYTKKKSNENDGYNFTNKHQ